MESTAWMDRGRSEKLTPLFTDVILDEERANATCVSQGCVNKVLPPFMKMGKEKPWYNYMTRCGQCQHYMHKYKVTTPERNKLLKQQDNKCAICAEEISFGSKSANLDHCHNTQKVRGVLCFNCNTALGSFKDNILILQNAIKYLELNNGKKTTTRN